MKIFFFIPIYILVFVGYVSAQAIHCPDSGEGYTFNGPDVKTNIYGRSKAKCTYFQGGREQGYIEVFYFRDYDRQKSCNKSIYEKVDMASTDYQVYGFFKVKDRKNDLGGFFWRTLLKQLIQEVEDWALPCHSDRRLIRRPAELNKK